MLMPSIFRESLIDDFFGFDHPAAYQKVDSSSLMRSDVKEREDEYELNVSLPGYKKEDIRAEVKDGYLTIQASASRNNEDKNGKYIRRERYSGSCSRSFYVGEGVTQEEIRAKYENGVLSLTIPKKDHRKKEEEKKYINIEG